jgi:hypothetical protein
MEETEKLAGTIELAKFSYEKFNSRRIYEWKISFGVYVAIGFITYFGLAIDRSAVNDEDLRCLLVSIQIIYGIVFLCHSIWVYLIQKANWTDSLFQHYYALKAESLLGNKRASKILQINGYPIKESGKPNIKNGDFLKKHIAWFLIHIFPTGTFLLLSYILIKNPSFVLRASG